MAIVQLIKYDDLPDDIQPSVNTPISLTNNGNGTLTIESTYVGGFERKFKICSKDLVSGHKYCIISIPKYTLDSEHNIQFQIDYGDMRRYDYGGGIIFTETITGTATFNLLVMKWNGTFNVIPQVFDLTESNIDVDSVDEFKSNYLSYFLTDIANSIKTKKGITDNINAQDFSTEIDNIQTGIVPSGKLEITDTGEKDVTNYAKAQVVDSDLTPDNIKKDINILGVTGTYEGSGDTLKALLDYTQSTRCMFYGNTNITDLTPYFSYNSTSNVTDMNSMFYYCTNLTTIPKLDTSNVTNMYKMFQNCNSLLTIPQLNTAKVIDMAAMFNYCKNLVSISAIDTSSVVDMNSMFFYCSKLTTIPKLDTPKNKTLSYTFYNCSKLKNLPSIDVSNTTNMDNAFYGCRSLEAITFLGSSNKVTDMQNAFGWCTSLTMIPALDASNVTNLDNVFINCTSVTKILMYGMKASFSISSCGDMDREDLVTILNNLASVTSTRTLKMGSTNLEKLTDEDKAIATGKGWSLS